MAADGGGDVALPGGHALPGGDRRHGFARATRARSRAAGVPLHEVAEQDTTDLEKCLYSVAAPLFIGLGFLGGRIDHHLAAMNALVANPGEAGGADRRRRPLLPLPAGSSRSTSPPGTRVSLFPMAPVSGAASSGLRWPVDGLAFRPDGRIGTSNAALGGPVRLGFDAPRMLVILPAALLGPVADRLRGAPSCLSSPAPR